MNFFTPALLSDAVFELDNGLSFAERITQGLSVLLFGMGVVFAVLILLWAILIVFKIVFYDIPNKKNKPSEPKVEPNQTIELPAVTSNVNEEELAAAIAAATAAAASDEAELVAAITAAISLTLDKPQTSFRVVSFRRTASK